MPASNTSYYFVGIGFLLPTAFRTSNNPGHNRLKTIYTKNTLSIIMKGQTVLAIVALILVLFAGIYSYRHKMEIPEVETKPSKPAPFYPNLTSPTVVKTPTGTICGVRTFGSSPGIWWEEGGSIFACEYGCPMDGKCEKIWHGDISPGLSAFTFHLKPPLTYTEKERRFYYLCYRCHGGISTCDLITEFFLCPS